MIDHISEQLAQAIADYANKLFSQGETVNRFNVLDVLDDYRDQDFYELMEDKHD